MPGLYCIYLFMAALCTAGHIYFHPVVSSSSFFPRLISAVGDWIPYFHTWCGLSVDLQCRSETCYARLAENTARKKSPKSRHLGTILQLCRAISSQPRHVSTIRRKKLVISSNISSTCPHNMVNFGPLAAEICWRVWGTHANFNGFASWQRYCTAFQYWASAKLCGVDG